MIQNYKETDQYIIKVNKRIRCNQGTNLPIVKTGSDYSSEFDIN